MKGPGTFLLLIAFALGVYALAIFDPTVETGMGRVYNIGQMQARQNMLIVAGVLAVIGTVLIAIKSGPATPEQQFIDAIKASDLSKMSDMLSKGEINPDGKSTYGMSWLRTALLAESVAATEVLLRHGANPNTADSYGTALKTLQHANLDRNSSLKAIMEMYLNPPPLETPQEAKNTDHKVNAQPRSQSVTEQLLTLSQLKEAGSLSQDEFEAAKAKVLA